MTILSSYQQILQCLAKNGVEEFLCSRWCEAEKLRDKQVFPGRIVHKTKVAAAEKCLERILRKKRKPFKYKAAKTLQGRAKKSETFLSPFCACGMTMMGSSSSVVRTLSRVPRVKVVERFLKCERPPKILPARKDVNRPFISHSHGPHNSWTYPSWHDLPPPSCPPCLPSPRTKPKYNAGIICKGSTSSHPVTSHSTFLIYIHAPPA